MYNSTNTIEIVEAGDEIKAIILAVEEEMIDLDIDNVEELLQYYHDGDIIVSRAVKI